MQQQRLHREKRMNIFHRRGRFRWTAAVALVLGLSACAQGGSPTKVWPAVPAKPPAPPPKPQVAYRIDDHRYFEITPSPDGECSEKMLYFVDTAKGIRSKAVQWDNVMTQGSFVIDAANDQYLVAPVTRGGTNCSSGGGICGDKMPYSTDGGRTWKQVWAPSPYDKLHISGSKVYQIDQDNLAREFDLSSLPVSEGRVRWPFIHGFVFKPHTTPAETKVRCSAEPEESRR
jgi:hypothetical protein